MTNLQQPAQPQVRKKKMAFRFFLSITIAFLFAWQSGMAQVVNFEGEKEGSQLYAKYFGIVAKMNFGDQGFIIVIGSELNKKPYTIYYFDAEGKLVWKKPTEREYPIGFKKEAFLCTPDGAYFYYIQVKDDRFYDKITYVQQISIDGTEKKFEIEGKEEFGRQVQTVTCDVNYLYFITTEDGNEMRDKKKTEEKLILNRFDHKTMAPQKFTIKTPAIAAGDETSFWSYIGSRDDIKFFSSKHSDLDLNKNDFTIIGVNASGEVKSNLKFSATPETGKFIRPCYTASLSNNVREIIRVDYESKTVVNGSGGGTSSRLVAKPTAFGHVMYDPNNDAFLVYGLYGPKKFHNLGPVYSGSYVYKFDLNGQNVWKAEQPAGDKLMDLGYFRVHSSPTDRDVVLQTLADKRILLTIDALDGTKAPFLFSPEGKFLKSDYIERMKKLDYQGVKIAGLVENLKSINYIETTLKEEKGDVINILNSKGEVILYFPSKDKPFKTIFFKK
jgi:hypothetical protein